MSKRTKIILIIIASVFVVFILWFLFVKPNQQTGESNSLQNLFPFGQPKSNQDTQATSGLETIPGQTGQATEQPSIDQTTSTGGTTIVSVPATETSDTITAPTTSAPVQESTPTTGQTPTAPTPSAESGIPQAPTPATGLPSLTAVAAPILAAKPTTQTSCLSGTSNQCFNKIEAAIYYAKAELAEINEIITMLRGNATTESIPTKIMKLDQCIPGPDYGFANRIQTLLENNEEWKSIGANGSSTFDIRKKAGVNLEINDTINKIRTELAFTSKNIPMAQDGFAFINATPKYNEILRDYRDRQITKTRTLASLQNLNQQWKDAKASGNTADQQRITVMFANFGTEIPTQEAWYEAANTRAALAQDVITMTNLYNTCGQQKNDLRYSFASQQTNIASKVLQPLRDIVSADESKRLYCPIDKYHVNNISREISGTLLYQIAVVDNTVSDNPESGPGWGGLQLDDAGSNMHYEPLNTQQVWYDATVFYPVDQILLQAETLRSILQRHNPEMGYIGTIQDQEEAVGGQSYFDNPNYVNDVLIDDHTGLRRHSLYSFGISCEAIYKSSRFDYVDELTMYGF